MPGVENSKRLLEDIPNKIQNSLGIVADVNRLVKDGRDYIEIRVSPSSFPISYHGEFHYRSRATKQQLTGVALSQFIMHKTGFRWEDVTVDGISADDLDIDSLRIFCREALRRNRMSQEELNVSNKELLDKLHLTRDGKLKRSAILLFYHDPSVIQNGCRVQIGKFGEGADLQYQDVLEGSLIDTADKVVDLIYLKYLKAKITFSHDRRVELYPYARNAIRETVYNAIAHNCYMFGTPIQIRIENDAMIISNRCVLPEGWTVDTFMKPHDSVPYNPDIANVFYRAGYIEQWGRGIQNVCESCDAVGAERPVYEILGNSLRVHFKALASALFDQDSISPDGGQETRNGGLDGGQETGNGGLDGGQKARNGGLAIRIVNSLKINKYVTLQQIADSLKVSKRAVEREVRKLQSNGVVSREGGTRHGYWQVNYG